MLSSTPSAIEAIDNFVDWLESSKKVNWIEKLNVLGNPSGVFFCERDRNIDAKLEPVFKALGVNETFPPYVYKCTLQKLNLSVDHRVLVIPFRTRSKPTIESVRVSVGQKYHYDGIAELRDIYIFLAIGSSMKVANDVTKRIRY